MAKSPDELLEELNILLDDQQEFEKIARKRILDHLNFFMLISYAIFFTSLFLIEFNFYTISIMLILFALMVVKHMDMYYLAKWEIPTFRSSGQGKVAKYAAHVTAFYRSLYDKQKGE